MNWDDLCQAQYKAALLPSERSETANHWSHPRHRTPRRRTHRGAAGCCGCTVIWNAGTWRTDDRSGQPVRAGSIAKGKGARCGKDGRKGDSGGSARRGWSSEAIWPRGRNPVARGDGCLLLFARGGLCAGALEDTAQLGERFGSPDVSVGCGDCRDLFLPERVVVLAGAAQVAKTQCLADALGLDSAQATKSTTTSTRSIRTKPPPPPPNRKKLIPSNAGKCEIEAI